MEQMLVAQRCSYPVDPLPQMLWYVFGGEPATVILNNGSLIKVQSPGMSGEGEATVVVEMADGAGVAPGTFRYFEDGTNSMGAYGVIEMTEYVGPLWSSNSVEGIMQIGFTMPSDFHLWQWYVPAINTCASMD